MFSIVLEKGSKFKYLSLAFDRYFVVSIRICIYYGSRKRKVIFYTSIYALCKLKKEWILCRVKPSNQKCKVIF